MNTLIYKIFSQKYLTKFSNKVKKLGSDNNFNIGIFLSLRLLITIFIFIFILINNKYGYILAPLISLTFYFGLEYLLLDLKIKKRGLLLEKEALFFFEILALSLEGGKNLHHALKMTSENIDSQIAREFRQTLTEVRLGKSLNESLADTKKRIPSEAINNVILQMIQANSYGTNIRESMYNQIEFLRNKQILDVKATINKLPTKISVISVIFIIPIMLLVILAPVLINFLTK